jgi:UDP-glucose 4-epimerase
VQVTKDGSQNIFITGGAGFFGSVFAKRLLSLKTTSKITIFDRNSLNKERSRINFSDSRITLVEGDLKDLALLRQSMAGHDTVIHLASNPDIARAVKEPTIDFEEGTVLTKNMLEAARTCDVSKVLYASGSGVYGDAGAAELQEQDCGRLPISTYGASKLAGEALLSAYCHMFALCGIVFRFANIVGAGQTHGIALDFVEKLRKNPRELLILGDGSQTKSYIHADDAFDAVWLAHEKCGDQFKFDIFNVATADAVSVNEIAMIAIEEVVGKDAKVALKYTGSERGWKGDVPVVKLNTEKIRALGFAPKHNSGQAVRLAIRGILAGAAGSS